MAFVKKEWKARLVEFSGRRALRNVSTGESVTYDVTRNEGAVSQEGDTFSPENMNGLEQRIFEGFADVDSDVQRIVRNISSLSASGAISAYTVEPDGLHVTYITADGQEVKKKLGSEGTALAAQVLEGYTFSNNNEIGISGTMANNGAVAKTITPSASTQTYTIPAGYHNGSGKVTVNAKSNTITSKSISGYTVTKLDNDQYEIKMTIPSGHTLNKTCFVVITGMSVWDNSDEPYQHMTRSVSISISGTTLKFSGWRVEGLSGTVYFLA